MAAQDRPRRLAVLIDAENVPSHIAENLFARASALGEASVRRIYGDFSDGKLKCWSDAMTRYAIVPQQTSACAAGKNAADIALVIDAMDLLHGGRLDGFCLVSSDSDFTRLAMRIREAGADVYGFGEAKTPASFRQACRFVDVGTFGAGALESGTKVPTVVAVPANDDGSSKFSPADAVRVIEAALCDLSPSNGWQLLSNVRKRLDLNDPGFSPQRYGCAKMVSLVERSGAFEVRRDKLVVYIKSKHTRAA